MRKDVTLGMSIGGVVLAVVIVIVSLSSHNRTNRHPVETGQIADSNAVADGSAQAALDAASGTPDAASKNEIAPPPEPAAPAVTPKTDDRPQVAKPDIDISPATKPADSTASAAATDKQDPIWGGKLWGNAPTPLLGTSSAPDPNAAAAETVLLATSSAPAVDTPKPPDTAANALTIAPSDRTATTQPSGAAHTHTVQKGETFSTIAATAYGSANFYPYLMRANPNIDPKALRPGMVIAIPEMSVVKPAEKLPAPAASEKTSPAAGDSAQNYTVQPGDSLNKIALTKFGKVDIVSRIYELNKQTIGDDPAKLKVGMVLKMPPPAVAVVPH